MLYSQVFPAGLTCLLISLASAQSFVTVAVPITTPIPPITVKTISPGCPTITSVTHAPSCSIVSNTGVARICATPDCILLSTITHGCACPATVATSFSYLPCTQCFGCRTSYVNLYVPCPMTSIPATSTTKVTVATPY